MEISEATDVPGTLLEFVNDTLVSTYPPEPRNLNASRWLLRNLTQLVDKCPVEMLRCVLEIIQDGLATWISDEYRIFNQDDYDVDVVPLYENVAVCSRSIISVDTIVALAPVFRAGFVGRSDKPGSIANAFNDFWHTAVAQVSPPAEGWPEELLVCLPVEQVVPVAFEANTEAATLPDVQSSLFDADQEDTLDGILRPAFDFDSSLPTPAKAVEEAEVPSSPPPAEASLVDVKMLSTPKKMSSPSSSSPPHRPSKSVGSAKFGPVLFSPQSPLAPAISHRVRSPATPKRSTRSPDKMDISADKENASTRRPLVSVMERIAMQSSPIVSVLGKRSQAEPASDERPTKRERLAPSPMQLVASSSSRDIASHAPPASPKTMDVGDVESEADCMQVEQTLFAFPASAQPSPPPAETTAKTTTGPLRRSVSPCPSPRPSARKRKLGVFLDAIEVPLLKDVRRQERRQNSAIYELSLAIRVAPSDAEEVAVSVSGAE
ncbi:hypothetical protein EWM64_g3097 [Hericium alpestre]|uniref:Uncharacterized protein n=1 Tax=Hericium alpestre TaxID=135208 RepID=A0A4Z0A5F1_9AGAM|nr:hypothetical protein EWM64_g3097 [Hericium alpestre]